jgi:hypothetical protein
MKAIGLILGTITLGLVDRAVPIVQASAEVKLQALRVGVAKRIWKKLPADGRLRLQASAIS